MSALGAVTTVAVTDASGRFQFGTLTPGPYLIRAHLAGFVAPRAELVQVKASAGTLSTIALRREGSVPVLAAGIGIIGHRHDSRRAADARRGRHVGHHRRHDRRTRTIILKPPGESATLAARRVEGRDASRVGARGFE